MAIRGLMIIFCTDISVECYTGVAFAQTISTICTTRLRCPQRPVFTHTSKKTITNTLQLWDLFWARQRPTWLENSSRSTFEHCNTLKFSLRIPAVHAAEASFLDASFLMAGSLIHPSLLEMPWKGDLTWTCKHNYRCHGSLPFSIPAGTQVIVKQHHVCSSHINGQIANCWRENTMERSF